MDLALESEDGSKDLKDLNKIGKEEKQNAG